MVLLSLSSFGVRVFISTHNPLDMKRKKGLRKSAEDPGAVSLVNIDPSQFISVAPARNMSTDDGYGASVAGISNQFYKIVIVIAVRIGQGIDPARQSTFDDCSRLNQLPALQSGLKES